MFKVGECVLVSGCYLKVSQVIPSRDGIMAGVSFSGVDSENHLQLWGCHVTNFKRWRNGRFRDVKLSEPHAVI